MKLKSLLVGFLFPFLTTLSFSEAVENSIVPQVEKFENITNLPVDRYSKNQLLEIIESLNQKEERIRVATYNVLFDLYDDYLEEVNRWPQRLPRIVELIQEMQPDILGVQELYPHQLKDLFPYLKDVYAFYAQKDGLGELNGIFYRKERFEVLNSHVWSMTSSPDVPSSAQLTLLQLKDLKTEKCVAVLNTHLAFSKIEKRDFQVRFIARKIEMLAEKMPVILMGDMNTFPQRLDLDKLPFYDGDYVSRLLTKKYLKDAKDVSLLGHLGPLGSFTNLAEDVMPFKGTGTPGIFLDHIYVSDEITVLMHAVQPGTVEGHFPSDHMPVLIDCLIENSYRH